MCHPERTVLYRTLAHHFERSFRCIRSAFFTTTQIAVRVNVEFLVRVTATPLTGLSSEARSSLSGSQDCRPEKDFGSRDATRRHRQDDEPNSIRRSRSTGWLTGSHPTATLFEIYFVTKVSEALPLSDATTARKEEPMAANHESDSGRNLVLCSDGTGQRGGKSRTNVWRIYQAIDRTARQPEQLAFYEDGVGVEDFKPFKLIGGATGAGLSHNIRLLYRWLMLNYRDGDNVYLFGFSRGAYTVRTFAGMLAHCGLVVGGNLNGAHAQAISREVYSGYYRCSLLGRIFRGPVRKPLPSPFQPKSVQTAQSFEVIRPRIRFLGVWDTVGAVGLPPWLRRGRLNPVNRIFRFHDINANNWQAAGHAMAIDDERKSFWPEPLPEANAADQEISQVWFAGAHSNVGGGYPKDGLAFSALDWMMTKAGNAGLVYSPEAEAQVRHRRNAHDRIYNPRAGARAYFRYSPRDFDRIERKFEVRYRPDRCKSHPMNEVHEDVFERILRSTSGYAPQVLPGEIKVVATGKGPGGTEDSGEQSRVADYKKRLASCDAAGRAAEIGKLRKFTGPTWIRKGLYWLLITFTVLLAADLLWLMEGDPVVPMEVGKPLELAAKAVKFVLPSFAEDLAVRLLNQAKDYPKLSVFLVLLLGGCLIWRHRLKKKGESISLKAWHPFRK